MGMFDWSVGSFGGLFGFKMKNNVNKDEQKVLANNNVIEVENDDASALIDATYAVTSQANIHGSLQTQSDLINEYRLMAFHPEVDNALDDIVNAVVSCDEDEDPVSIDLEKVDVSDATKDKIVDEFDTIIELMNFNRTAYERVRQWYVDGRLVFHAVVDPKREKEGILKLIPLDPRATRKFKEIKKTLDATTGVEKITEIDDYFLYDKSFAGDSNTDAGAVGQKQSQGGGISRRTQAIKLSIDSVIQVHTGILASDNSSILSNLEKARKPLNNLKMMEDAMVVYRITRAPERRVFYIDVGTLPKKAAEEYMVHTMNKYKSRMVYDPSSGKVNGNAHQISMNEDFWLPRREGGTGTQIDTLQGGQNLNDIDDILYFQRKLYKSLNVPQSRIDQDDVVPLGGRGAEITRDEWKFDKFVRRLRRRFSELFSEIMRRQLILKGITTQDDWDTLIAPFVQFKYASDSYMKAQQEAELLNDRLATLAAIDQYVGKYFSRDFVKRKVLNWTDEDIKDQEKKIKKELAAGDYPDPATVDDDGNSLLPPPMPITTPGFGFTAPDGQPGS